MVTTSCRIFVIFVVALLGGSQFAMADSTDVDKLSSIYAKLVAKMKVSMEGYSEEEKMELHQGVKFCATVLKEGLKSVDSSNTEVAKKLAVSMKRCVAKEILQFLYVRNKDLGLSEDELEFLNPKNEALGFIVNKVDYLEEIKLFKILSGIFGVMIFVMFTGTLIGCCSLCNTKKRRDDRDTSDTSYDEDSLEFDSNKPSTPLLENHQNPNPPIMSHHHLPVGNTFNPQHLPPHSSHQQFQQHPRLPASFYHQHRHPSPCLHQHPPPNSFHQHQQRPPFVQ